MSDPPVVRMWTPEPPTPEVRKTIDRLARAPDVARIAVMPDVHLAAGVSNGVVVATRRLIYPAAVGGDIGCGFATIALDGPAGPLRSRSAAEAILEALPRAVPVMRHKRRDQRPEPASAIHAQRLSAPELMAQATRDGWLELGTLGRGNHFLEIQADDQDRLWIMVHSGSRAMGQHITAFHGRRATPVGGGLAWLDADSEEGRAYLRDVTWARAYAAESRRRMLDAAVGVLAEVFEVEPDPETMLNTDHNHVQLERHGGESLWVHRKGANCAEDGLANMIPGSMATHTYHVEGRGDALSLTSSSHGAGRRLSRSAARAKIRKAEHARRIETVWINPRIASRLVDESPAAYKDIHVVMRAQRDLVRMVRRVRPLLCHKGV